MQGQLSPLCELSVSLDSKICGNSQEEGTNTLMTAVQEVPCSDRFTSPSVPSEEMSL